MKQLTEIEYNVLMKAIDIAKNAIADDAFIDPYNNEEGYTNDILLEALESAENKVMENMYAKNDYFTIARLHRDDLEAQGYDVTCVTDEEMEKIAKKLGDAYVENSFWVDLEIIADDLGIKQK